MKNEKFALGIDIGGTNTKVGLFGPHGDLLHFFAHTTDKTIPAEKFIEQLAQECQSVFKKDFGFSLGDNKLVGVGVGAPMANYFSGFVDYAPNLGWKKVPLKNLFAQHFKTLAIIENDANLAAYGEKKWGSGKSFSDFALITLGTGVGTGFIVNNKLHRGHNALGAEGGHIIIPAKTDRKCSCGGINHLESFLSAQGIKETIVEMTGEHWTIEKLGVLFNQGDSKASEVMRAIVDQLVSGLVSMAVLFGPEAFIIGGGVSKLGDSFNRLIQDKLSQIVHFSLQGKIVVLTASLSAEKGAINGGAALVFSEVDA